MKKLQILILENGFSPMSFPKKHWKMQFLTPQKNVFFHMRLPFDATDAFWIKKPLTKKINNLPIAGVFSPPSLSFLSLPTPAAEDNGLTVYQALLPAMISSILSLLFPMGAEKAILDVSMPELLLPMLVPRFRQIGMICSEDKRESYANDILSTWGVAPIFTNHPTSADFFVTDRMLCSSSEPFSCVLSFAGHFPHAARHINHNRILLRPKEKLRAHLPAFIREITLSEGAAILQAGQGVFSCEDFAPRPLFAIS